MTTRAARPWAMVGAMLVAVAAHADNVDIGAALATKLNAKAAGIFEATTGKPMPAGTVATITFKGSIAQSGLGFTMPPAIPQKSSVLMQSTLANCDGSQATQRVAYKQSTAQTESWRAADTATAPVPVRATLSTPPGTAFDPATVGYGRDWNAGGEATQTLAWDAATDVPVANGRKVNVQFVVDEQTVEAPFKATFTASGNATFAFEKPSSGVLSNIAWVSQQPASPVPGGSTAVWDENTWTRRYDISYTYQHLCRGMVRGERLAGRVIGDACVIAFPGGFGTAKPFEWLSANWGTLQPTCQPFLILSPKPHQTTICTKPPDNPTWDRAFEWVDGDAANPLKAGPNGTVCRVTTGKYAWVVGNASAGRCRTYTGPAIAESATYQTINIRTYTRAERTTTDVNIEDLLPVADRTFALRGIYKGVTAVQGDFRLGTPRVPTCDTAKVKSVGAASSGGRVPGAAGATPAKAPPESLPSEDLKTTAALPKSDAVPRTAVKPKAAAPAKRS